jgi:putative transposase
MWKSGRLVKLRKAFKFRIYPTENQAAELAIQFGHARFVYNFYRAAREGYYLDTGEGLSYEDCAEHLKDILKADYPWLKEADSQTLQQKLKDLDRAYKNFFDKRADYPNFKAKHEDQSIRYPQRFKIKHASIYLPKVGWVRMVKHRAIKGTPKNVTVTKTKSGRYFVSIQCEIKVQRVPEPEEAAVGVDLGLTPFATLSTGEKSETPKFLRRSMRRVKIRQRRLSRKVKGSNNRHKARLPLARIHEKVANQRKDFQHKLSRDLVDQFGSISFESLNVNGMLKNHNLAQAISDAAWSQFVGCCEYKATQAGGQVLRVDRFFPSSKLCADCGEKHRHLTLSVRQWVCLNCGVLHDRDINAAVNILNQTTLGARESYACGVTSASVGASAHEQVLAVPSTSLGPPEAQA